MQEQYKKVKEFHHLQSQSYPEYAELFSADNLPEIKQFPEQELRQAFGTLLNLYGHEFTIPEIDHLLKIDNLAPLNVFKNLIELGKIEATKFIINNTKFNNQVFKHFLDEVFDTNYFDLIQLILNKIEKIDDWRLHNFIELANSDKINSGIIKLLFEKADPNSPVAKVLELGNTNMFNLAFEIATEASYDDLKQLSNLSHDKEIIDLACSKFKWKTKEQLGTKKAFKKALDLAIKEDEESCFINLLIKQLKQVSFGTISTAVCYKKFKILPKLFENLKPKEYEECLKLVEVEKHGVPLYIREQIKYIILRLN